MKRLFLLFTFLFNILIYQKLTAQISFEWLRPLMNNNTDESETEGIVVDSQGNVYVAGAFASTIDFDPGPGVYNLSSNQGSYDIFVAKYNANGALIWAKSFGGKVTDRAVGVDIDDSGNVYLAGMFRDTVNFETGNPNAQLVGVQNGDMFVLKLNDQGQFRWVQKAWGLSAITPSTIAVHKKTGAVYVGGYFNSELRFGPNPGSLDRIAYGSNEAFLVKYETDGSIAWTKSMGGQAAGQERVNDIAVDTAGNVYATGSMSTLTDFNIFGVGGTLNASSDGYLVKYNAAGIFQWAFAIAGSGYDEGRAVVADTNGFVYVTGHFKGNVNFNPLGTASNLSSISSFKDAFFAKYTDAGINVWARNIGSTTSGPQGESIGFDAEHNVYVTGYFSYTIDCDPGTAVANLTAANNASDIFYAKYNEAGDYLWAKRIGGPDAIAYSTEILLDKNGALYLCGYIKGTANFNIGSTPIVTMSSGNNNGAYFVKYTQVPVVPAQLTASFSEPDMHIGLSWVDNATNESGYKVEREDGNGGFVEIANLPANSNSYTDAAIVLQSEYKYRVKAYNNYGPSLYSNIALVNTTPSRIKTLEAMGIQIAPNPTSDVLHISLKEQRNAVVSFWNINGKQIFRKKMDGTALSIVTSHLPDGMYLLGIEIEGSIYTKKIIVSH